MIRYTFAIKIKKEKSEEYLSRLGKVWPEVTALLDRNHIDNFSLWKVEQYVFGYCELPDGYSLAESDSQKKVDLIHTMEDTFEWISDPNQNMKLMYQDYGIVRDSKELIRHRVFMTKLKAGCETEYKHRHDKLIEQRGNHVNPGPDSNFSIWSAGGYIFGYDEIDTTMEQEETKEQREQTIAWETKQLEIMDWITDDVDWMTGERHSKMIRIAWHKK